MSNYEIKFINKTTQMWRLPRSSHANFGMFEVRPNDDLEFSLQDFSLPIYGAYREIELSIGSDGHFKVKTKKRKNWKVERDPDKFYIRLKNVSGVLIVSVQLDKDREYVRLPLGIDFELEISPFDSSILYESIEVHNEQKTDLSTNDPGYGLGRGKYVTVYNPQIKRTPRSDAEMERVRKARLADHEARLARALKTKKSEKTG